MPRRKPRKIVYASTPTPQSGPAGLLGDAESSAAALGETFRRVALGLSAALIVSRFYWPAEFHGEDDTGWSLLWVAIVIATFAIGAAGMWLGGGLRLRRSWTDIAVAALFALVAASVIGAANKRVAINLAWESSAVALLYLMLRNLPRTRAESSALAGSLVATAVALSCYGLFQVAVELPRQRAQFEANPRPALISAGLDPEGDPAEVARFRDRLVGSSEPVATFALTNTLAGVLVGPAVVVLVVGLRSLGRRDLGVAALMAAPLALALLACLLLTKSRSAYLGLFAALLLLAWSERARVGTKALLLASLAVIVGAAGLVGAATLAGQLDRQVITESSKSLSYRSDYWRGSWGVIARDPGRWMSGVGPGNFAGPYLRSKPPLSSEEIADPHNLFLETWATAGLPALIAVVAALGFSLRELLGPPRRDYPPEKAHPPTSSAWLVLAAGVGGWVLATALGQVSPFEPDSTGRRMNLGLSARWVILLLGWLASAGLGRSFWARCKVPSDALGLAMFAIAVNLLAAGGIGFAPVALMLWGMAALGQDLRDDRDSSVIRDIGGRGLAFIPLAASAALIGTFLGTVPPHWRADSAIKAADSLLTRGTTDPEEAASLYRRAAEADPYGSRAWLSRANLEFRAWEKRGRPSDLSWHRIDSALRSAVKPPRDPDALLPQRLRARMAQSFLMAPDLIPAERYRIRTDRLDACLAACALHPTDASLRADLAEAYADLDRFPEAIEAAGRALAADAATPHLDKKLPTAARLALEAHLTKWRAKPAVDPAKSSPSTTTDATSRIERGLPPP